MGADHRGRILVVDDEVELMRALCDGLADEGFEVEGHADPLVALDGLRPGTFDVVIVDLMMPRLDGIQFLRRVVLVDRNLAVVLMTGEASDGTIDEASKAGAFDYIPKPFKLASLLSVVERALQAGGGAPIERGT